MNSYPTITYFNCDSCGKELSPTHRNFRPYNVSTCADCEYRMAKGTVREEEQCQE